MRVHVKDLLREKLELQAENSDLRRQLAEADKRAHYEGTWHNTLATENANLRRQVAEAHKALDDNWVTHQRVVQAEAALAEAQERAKRTVLEFDAGFADGEENKPNPCNSSDWYCRGHQSATYMLEAREAQAKLAQMQTSLAPFADTQKLLDKIKDLEAKLASMRPSEEVVMEATGADEPLHPDDENCTCDICTIAKLAREILRISAVAQAEAALAGAAEGK